MEEIDEGLSDHRADSFDRGQFGSGVLGYCDAAEFVDCAEAFEQVPRGDDADVADAEAEEEARPLGLAFEVDRCEQIVDRLLLPSLAPEQLAAMDTKAKDVGGRV